MNDEMTTRLSRQLHAQVDDWTAAPLTLEGVQGRARTIRRRRQAIGTGAVAAAVLAVAIPVGLTFGGSLDSSPPPAGPVPSEVVDSDNPVAEGSEIGLPYLQDRTLTLPNGDEATLPRAYDGGAVLGTEVLGLRNDEGNLFLDVLGSDLLVEESIPLDTGFAQNADGTALAYVTRGELVVRWESGEASFGTVPAGLSPAGLLGGPDCADVTTCTVYLNDETGGAPRLVSGSGPVEDVAGSPVKVTDAAEDGQLALVTSVDLTAGGACSAVVTGAGGDQVFETCDHTLERFAPGGQHLSAAPAYQSGIGDTYAAIVDAGSGREVARFEASRGDFVWSTAWEDAEHLLVTTYSYGTGWMVVRLGTDGSQEVALGPDDSGDDTSPSFVVLGAS